MFNSTILVGLILSKYVGHQPLMTFPIQNLPFSLSISSFRFTNFSNSALFTQTVPHMKIERSIFSFFTRSPIVLARPNPFDPPNYEFREVCDPDCTPMTGLTVRDVTFQRCSTIQYHQPSEDLSDNKNVSGGAIYINSITRPGSAVKITQCNFLYCHAGRFGGALFISNNANSGSVEISFTYFQHCDVGFIINKTGIAWTAGGAIYCETPSLEIKACNFSNCGNEYHVNTSNLGGAIYAKLTNKLYVRFSDLAGCSYQSSGTGATSGGAIYVDFTASTTGGSVDIEYSNFTLCQANSTGSALHIEGLLNNVSIYFSVFAKCFTAESVIFINNTKNDSNLRFVNLHQINLQEIDRTIQYFCKIVNGQFVSSLGNNDLYCPGSYPKDKFSPMFDQNCIYGKTFPINNYIIPLDDPDLYTTYPIPPSTGGGDVTPSIVTSSPISDLTTTSPITSTNPGGDSVIDNQSNGLSTVAIVFIILAVIIVLAMIILAIIFCVKKGICSDNTYRVQDIRYLGQGDAIRETTYF